MLGEEQKEKNECDSQSLRSEVTARVDSCSPEESSEEHVHTTECSASTLYHTTFVIA